MNNLTLIIPAKNEKESLPQVLNELKNKNIKTHIILEKTINTILFLAQDTKKIVEAMMIQ